MTKLYIGIDTSCYTTSLAVFDGEKLLNLRKILSVKTGECGLRQSDAVFQHIKNLPELFSQAEDEILFKNYDEITVSVSSKPRNLADSYMPVFTAGQSFGKSIASVLGAEYKEFSHQEGHLMAALHSCGRTDLLGKEFLCYHLSGGTTELLKVGQDLSGEIIGGTLDIPAGQFIDRIGVLSGLDFPAGKFVDEMALSFDGDAKVSTAVKDSFINFSGEETRFRREIETGEDTKFVAYKTMKCISESIKKTILNAKEAYRIEDVIMVGGVSSSKFLRNYLADTKDIYFAEPRFSTDNAVGICLLGTLED